MKNGLFVFPHKPCPGHSVLQETHRIYRQKLEELTALQALCSSSIHKQKRRLKDLKHTLQRYVGAPEWLPYCLGTKCHLKTGSNREWKL